MNGTDKWIFLTNFDKDRLAHIIYACKCAEIRYKISAEATDIYDNIIPDTYALYISCEDGNKQELFWEYNTRLDVMESKYGKTIDELLQAGKY